jgi:hypothetical protein
MLALVLRRIDMDKKIAGLLGAVAAISSMTSANAAAPGPAETLQATSYADLLNPVPNAVAQLIADDAARATRSRGGGELDVAQIRVVADHHHHHHRYHRRHRHHHHHHHSNFMAIPRANV